MTIAPAHSPQPVSRETRRPLRLGLASAALIALGVAAAACSSTPGPKGWAGARPVTVDSPDLVLAAYRDNLFAIDPTASTTTPVWQFPAPELDNYQISVAGRAALDDQIDALDVAEDQKERLKGTDVNVSGDTIDAFTDAVNATSASDDQKDGLNTFVEELTSIEEDALDDVSALYGEIGVSDDDATAYVPGYSGWLYALDIESGRTRWMVELDGALVGGVAVDGDTLYVGDDTGALYALDADDGHAIETFAGDGVFKAGDEIWATPTVIDDAIFVTTMGGSLYRLDKQGAQVWEFDDSGAAIAMRAVVDGDTVYVGAYDERFYALSIDDGSKRWDFQAEEWFWSAPVVDGDTVFTASLDGKVYALNTEDGSERWEDPYSAGAEVRGALAMGARGIIVAGRDGFVHQVDPESGEAIGEPFLTGDSVEADLTNDAERSVYTVPTKPATLFIIDTSTQTLAASFFTLPD